MNEVVRDGARPAATVRALQTAVSLAWSSGRRLLVAILLATAVTSLTIAMQLLVGRELIDLLAESDDLTARDLAPWLVLLAGLLLVGSVCQAVASELRLPLAEQVQQRAMAEILDVSTEVELEAFEDPRFHDALTRARSAAVGQSSAVVFGLVTVASTLVVSIGIIFVLVAVAPVVVPIAAAGYIPVAIVNMRNNRATYDMEVELTELLRERAYLEHLLSDRTQAKEVRAYGIAPTIRSWHSDVWSQRIRRLHALVKRRLTRSVFASVATTAALVAALSVVFLLAAKGSITLGDAAAAIVGLQQLSSRLQSAGSGLSAVHSGTTFLHDFDSFRATLPQLRTERASTRPPTPPAVLSVDRIGYRYPGAHDDALVDVSFELRRGQVMAIVGANGSGKTTLAKLLCGLLPPTRGAVSWDGVDLALCDPELVRAQIAPVFQDYSAFMLTIRQAIGLGDVDRFDDEVGIAAAASRAGVGELTTRHPKGLDVRLGKAFRDGIDISVGQWQRVAIARALFREAPVVILDEPSASLDPQAEAALFDTIEELGHDRITIFVSHRFATVRSADIVLVMDHGEVVETGTHDELIGRGGMYHDLYTLQAQRFGLAERSEVC